MNKADLINYIAEENKYTKVAAEKVIDMFTSSAIDALAESNDISLIGFGHFSVKKVAAREGRNPRTGKPLKIAASNQVKFKVGQRLKNACNKK